MSYDIFAKYYDLLMKDVDYHGLAEYYNQIFNVNGIAEGILLDLGCGTGKISSEMSKLGYDVIGVDTSIGMLMKARENTYGLEKEVLLLNQSMESLDLYGTVDCAVSVLDCINHLGGPEHVKKAFENVSLFMNPGGVFAFDMNTVHKHRNTLANNSFIYEDDGVFCAWQNTLNDDDSIDISLDFFEEDDGAYYRESENFTEKAYPTEKITELLEQAGFEVLNIYEGNTFNNLTESGDRAVFVARKR